MHALTPAKAALAAAVAGGVLLTGGVAAAATGELPGPAQDTARHMLSHVGVTVPGSTDDSSGQGNAAGQGKSAQGAGGSGQATDRQHPAAHGKGAGVSALAHATPPGTQHGKTVSSYASGGKSHAGQHGKAGEHSDSSGHSGSSGGSGSSVEVRDHQPTTPTRPGDPTAHLPGHGVGGRGSGGGSGSGH